MISLSRDEESSSLNSSPLLVSVKGIPSTATYMLPVGEHEVERSCNAIGLGCDPIIVSQMEGFHFKAPWHA